MNRRIRIELATFLELLREEFLREEKGGFALLSQIPSTHVTRFLKYYRRLQPGNVAKLRDALCRNALRFACHRFAGDDREVKMTEEESTAYKLYTDTMAAVWWGWECKPVTWLIHAAGVQKAGATDREILPPEVLEWARGLKSAKANELRKLVKQALAQRHGLHPEKHGGGVWFYRNAEPQLQFEVCIDYGGMNSQIRCEVNFHNEKQGLVFERSSFEQLMGLSFSDWDFILESQADQKIALLADLVDYVVQFFRRAIKECS